MSTMPDWSYSNKIAILSHLLVVIFYYSNVCIATTHSPHRGYSNWSGSTRRTISAFGDPKYFTNQYITTDKPDVMILVPNFDVLFEVSQHDKMRRCGGAGGKGEQSYTITLMTTLPKYHHAYDYRTFAKFHRLQGRLSLMIIQSV